MVVVTTTVEATTERKRVTETACMPIAVAMSASESVALGSMKAAARMNATSPMSGTDRAFARETQDEAREHDPDAEGPKRHAALQGDVPMAAGESEAGKHGVAGHIGGEDAAVHIADRVGEAGGAAEEASDADIVHERPRLVDQGTKSLLPHRLHLEPPLPRRTATPGSAFAERRFAG